MISKKTIEATLYTREGLLCCFVPSAESVCVSITGPRSSSMMNMTWQEAIAYEEMLNNSGWKAVEDD